MGIIGKLIAGAVIVTAAVVAVTLIRENERISYNG